MVVADPSETDEILRSLNNGTVNLLSSDLKVLLKEKMFIIPSHFDEVEFFRFNYFKSLYDTTVFRCTVLPTLGCNLTCPYCYEMKRDIYMSDETIDNFIKWLIPHLKTCKEFSLEWFGGEPLTRIDIIEKITNKILELQQQIGFKYSANITTNGVLLTPSIVHKMDELNINAVQVTFDGSKTYHDKYRKHPNGKGSFETIINNIDYYCTHTKSMNALHVRINVTDENYDSIPELLKALPISVKKRSVLFFRWIYENSASEFIDFSSLHRGKNPFNNLAPLYKAAQEQGFFTNNLDEQVNFNYCECDFVNKFRIDPEGNLYLCTQSYLPEEAIGNVAQGGLTEQGLNYYCKIANINPFSDNQCLECLLLPHCKGGCRKAALVNKRLCTPIKGSVDKYILMLYNKYNSQAYGGSYNENLV